MRVGGQRRVQFPPELGYGDTGAGSVIPGGATLIFDIVLEDINP
jgi:FK506-binding protein 14